MWTTTDGSQSPAPAGCSGDLRDVGAPDPQGPVAHSPNPGAMPGPRLRDLFDASPDAIVVVDSHGVIRDISDQATALFGYPREELVGRPLTVLIPVEHRDDHRSLTLQYMRRPAIRPMGAERELAARHRDGSHVPVSIALSPVHTEDGLFVIASARDATTRRREHERLESAEELFRTTIDHAPIGMGLVALDGRWLRVNRALCEMTGHREQALLGRRIRDVSHPDDVDLDRADRRRMLAGEITEYATEKRLIRADGSIRWVLTAVSLVRDASGAPKHFVTQIQDITERRDHEAELRHLAVHDALTGLANRRKLEEGIERHLELQARHGDGVALLMVDLDHFKFINDTRGHRVGDQVLCAAAEAMAGRLRKSDMVARLGGDEFAILLPRCDLDAARVVTEKILESLGDIRVDGSDHKLGVSASIGIVVAAPEDGYDRDALVAAADLAMYEAKEAGRNCYAVHDPGDHGRPQARDRLAWSHRIRRALAEDLFVLHYQPIVNVAGHDAGVPCYEALIRIADRPGELVGPDAFLEIAERYGLMCAIDRWVIASVIAGLAFGRLPAGATISINLSASSLAEPDLPELVERLLAEHGVRPSQLIFEIAEPAAIARLDEARTFGRRVRDLGCRVALDRFGRGFGSLIHLKRLFYDYIKIDGELVGGMIRDEHDRLLVDAIVGIARGMHKQTIAEFVGDDETMDELRAIGVDLAQGFHLGRPAPAEMLGDASDGRADGPAV